MIEATELEVKAYCMAMVHEIELAEEARHRQPLPVWVPAVEIYERIASGLQCTVNAAQTLLNKMAEAGLVEVHESGRAIRPALGVPCHA